MMLRVRQLGCRRGAGGGVLLLLLLAMLSRGVVLAQNVPAQTATPAAAPMPAAAQQTTPMPTAAAAVPMPKQAAGATPSVAQSQAPATKIVLPKLPPMPRAEGDAVDRVVAIVNGELILDSDVDRERRFAALLPYGEASGTYQREAAVERLINRDLILQQLALQPGDPITMEAAAKDLGALRASIPACKEFQCETSAGWDKFLASEGFSEESLTSLWRQRMEVLAFIELRFRLGIKITPEEIREYYEKTLLPQYAAQHAPPPPVRTISSRIQEVLLQQRVSKLLDDWLNSLRAQGNVVVLHPGEEAP
jgi:peptidyl-prolyl cis-trans isomerase SurA